MITITISKKDFDKLNALQEENEGNKEIARARGEAIIELQEENERLKELNIQSIAQRNKQHNRIKELESLTSLYSEQRNKSDEYHRKAYIYAIKNGYRVNTNEIDEGQQMNKDIEQLTKQLEL